MQDLDFGTGTTQSMEISRCFRYLIYSTFGLSATICDNIHSGLSILLEEDFEYGKCGGIVDMDGYQINNKFCKELGTLKIGEISASSYFFDIGVHWGKLAKEDKVAWARCLHRGSKSSS
jgi:hypothetical protein